MIFLGVIIYVLQIRVTGWLWTFDEQKQHNSESSVALETTHNHMNVHTGLCHRVTGWTMSSVSKVKCFITVIQIIFQKSFSHNSWLQRIQKSCCILCVILGGLSFSLIYPCLKTLRNSPVRLTTVPGTRDTAFRRPRAALPPTAPRSSQSSSFGVCGRANQPLWGYGWTKLPLRQAEACSLPISLQSTGAASLHWCTFFR